MELRGPGVTGFEGEVTRVRRPPQEPGARKLDVDLLEKRAGRLVGMEQSKLLQPGLAKASGRGQGRCIREGCGISDGLFHGGFQAGQLRLVDPVGPAFRPHPTPGRFLRFTHTPW